MTRPVVLLICLITALMLFLSGCSGMNSSATPTDDPIAIQKTNVAFLTQAFATIQMEKATDQSTPTETIQPTGTPTALPPTHTLVPTQTGTASITPILPTSTITITPTKTRTITRTVPTAKPKKDSSPSLCPITNQTPSNGAQFKPRSSFTLTWTLRNNSQDTWTQVKLDVAYLSGSHFHRYGDRQDIARNTAPGQTMDVTLKMVAPASAGSYSETWGLVAGSQPICTFSITIQVVP
jgi:hypothetical protein